MKTLILTVLLAALPMLAIAAPNQADVDAVAATPAQLGDKIDGMSCADSADFTKSVIDAVEANADLSEAEKEALILDVVTRFTVLSGDDAASCVGALVNRLGAYSRMDLVTATAIIAAGKNGDAVKTAILGNITDPDTLAAATAAADKPSATLAGKKGGQGGGNLLSALRQLLATIGATGGAAETYEGQE